MFVTRAIIPATSLVSAQIRPIIVPTTSKATIAANQYRIRRLVMVLRLLPSGRFANLGASQGAASRRDTPQTPTRNNSGAELDPPVSSRGGLFLAKSCRGCSALSAWARNSPLPALADPTFTVTRLPLSHNRSRFRTRRSGRRGACPAHPTYAGRPIGEGRPAAKPLRGSTRGS